MKCHCKGIDFEVGSQASEIYKLKLKEIQKIVAGIINNANERIVLSEHDLGMLYLAETIDSILD